ncbi:hypothetical protein [Desulfoplanes formicivorans]|uniref:Uncharacterized protein n=1 Tax=Desulfoplanes formicivorans TaxID=1592317 RepID=A0A194AIS1_9BACT|nr:hypothetical protein [Desulfoplanes formicivorans]GAU08971.1 hypothetical protein DPF_1690 [Desulfoplanes formicivorans]
MSKREKIILVVMAVVVVAGIYMLVMDSGTRKSVSDNSLAEAKSAKTAVNKEMGNLALSDATQYAIQSVNAPWIRDPFRKVSLEKNEQSVVKGDKPIVTFRYTAYVSIGKTCVGVINGREYEPGELLKEPGYRLLEVGPKKAVIAGPGQDNTIVVPYHDKNNK